MEDFGNLAFDCFALRFFFQMQILILIFSLTSSLARPSQVRTRTISGFLYDLDLGLGCLLQWIRCAWMLEVIENDWDSAKQPIPILIWADRKIWCLLMYINVNIKYDRVISLSGARSGTAFPFFPIRPPRGFRDASVGWTVRYSGHASPQCTHEFNARSIPSRCQRWCQCQ